MSRAEVIVVFALAGVTAAAAMLRIGRSHRWAGSAPITVAPGHSEPVKVDINSALWWEIAWLPTIGELKAKSVVEYRNAHGPFRTVDELARVPGIGTVMVEQLRDRVALSMPTPGSALPGPAETPVTR